MKTTDIRKWKHKKMYTCSWFDRKYDQILFRLIPLTCNSDKFLYLSRWPVLAGNLVLPLMKLFHTMFKIYLQAKVVMSSLGGSLLVFLKPWYKYVFRAVMSLYSYHANVTSKRPGNSSSDGSKAWPTTCLFSVPNLSILPYILGNFSHTYVLRII